MNYEYNWVHNTCKAVYGLLVPIQNKKLKYHLSPGILIYFLKWGGIYAISVVFCSNKLYQRSSSIY